MNFARLVAGAAALSVGALAFAQSAVLHDGTVLVQKVPLELFATEGPIWDIDVANRRILVTGRYVTIPASLNGVEWALEGTDLLDPFGAPIGAITAATLDRLTDSRAMLKDRVFESACPDCGPLRMGPTRSIFSTSEARTAAVYDGPDILDRLPEIQRMIEDNYFFFARNIYLRHSSVLPITWLGRVGIRNEDGSYPTSASVLPNRRHWRYPYTAGATLKSSGTIYVDAQGREYLIPELEKAFELSENVVIGQVRSVQFGDWTTPDSFIVGDVAVIMNQDPRFGAHVTGLAGQSISREYFFANLQPGMEIAVGGAMTGEHLQMAQEIEVSMFDASQGISISAIERTFRVDLERGSIQWRGEAMPIEANWNLFARIGTVEFPADVVPTLETPGHVRYDVRLDAVNLLGITEVSIVVRNAKGGIEAEQVFDITPFLQ